MLSRFLAKADSNKSYLLLALCLLLVLTFASVIGADYVYFDEHIEVLGNSLITAPLSFAGLLDIFSSFEANQYTPLSLASFWIEFNLFGFNSMVSHLINLLLHLGCATLVFYLAGFFFNNHLPAFILAAIWSLHPLQVETVAWVLERRNLLYGMFYFASLLAYMNYMQTPKRSYLVAATIFMACSGLAKTLAFILPFNWLLLDWLKSRRFATGLIKEKLPALVLATIFMVVMLFGAHGSVAGSGVGTINLQLASYNISFYFAKILLPINLSPTYEMHKETEKLFAMGPFYIAILALLCLFFGLQNRLIAFGLIFFFCHILPLSGLIRVGYKFYAVLHFVYVASFGVILALMAGMQHYVSRESWRRAALVGGLLLVLIFAAISHDYSKIWQNSQTLFSHCLQHDANNRFARNQLAVFYEAKGNLREAAKHFEELMNRYPEFFGGYFGLGRIFMRLEQPLAALNMLDKAMQYNQQRADIPFDHGHVLLLLGRFAAAEKSLSESLLLRENVRTRFMRSEARRKQGDYLGAITDMNQVVAALPDDFSTKVSLFELLIESGRGMDAIAELVAITGQIMNNLQNIEEYKAIICTPSLEVVLWRTIPYQNLLRWRFR